MIQLLDAHLPPGLAKWISDEFKCACFSLLYLKLESAKDLDVFLKAREMQAIMITKDRDFVNLLERHKSPPRIIWLTCGNTSKSNLKNIFMKHLSIAFQLLNDNDLVEITGK